MNMGTFFSCIFIGLTPEVYLYHSGSKSAYAMESVYPFHYQRE